MARIVGRVCENVTQWVVLRRKQWILRASKARTACTRFKRCFISLTILFTHCMLHRWLGPRSAMPSNEAVSPFRYISTTNAHEKQKHLIEKQRRHETS